MRGLLVAYCCDACVLASVSSFVGRAPPFVAL
jgi:hypothetical protein